MIERLRGQPANGRPPFGKQKVSMARPLRVVIDARLRDGLSGGVQQWVIGLAAALSKLDADTEEYLFLVDEANAAWLTPYLGGRARLLVDISPPGRIRSSTRLINAIRRLRARVATSFPSLRGIWRRLATPKRTGWLPSLHRTVERAGADVVHFTMQSAFATSIPSIYQPWDLQHVHLPEFFSNSQRDGREAAYRAYCDQAKLIVTASNWVKQDLIEHYGIDGQRIAIVNPPPVTPSYPVPSAAEREAIAGALKLPDRFIYYPAQTWGHKNHLRLLEALAQLRRRGIIVPLVCSGHRNERHPELILVARQLGIDSDVTFVGFLKPVEVQVLYGLATGLVFPSLYEGWGLPIVEAFASDLPVACSNVTSLPELVGDAAVLFDPYDPADIASAIERLWTDPAFAADLVKRGRARVVRFDWHRTALTMRAHYRNVAGQQLSHEDNGLIMAESIV
jgi:glycosyltransferase involved in cell wall biosynthesis